MKKVGYYFFKCWLGAGLLYYFSKIKIYGLEKIPKNKPVLFLANHQNALLDALLVAIFCKGKPYYLTRASAFTNPLVTSLLNFLQMIPIYRIRDGIDKLGQNEAIFNQCAQLLKNNEHILIFPEGSHNIKKRIRPLSKGFTRILFRAMEKQPHLDIRLLPIGINYNRAEGFPDSAAVYFDNDIPLLKVYDENNLSESIKRIKDVVYESLRKVTTHIENEEDYDEILAKLNSMKVNYLKPSSVNTVIGTIEANEVELNNKSLFSKILKTLFTILNYPFIVPWKLFILPKIKEIEFISTFRFMYSLIFYPVLYLIVFFVLGNYIGHDLTAILLLGHILFNRLYIRTYPFT
ncbi:1-acyl-sn-glycerol-3-phosphate acyltransferase [Saonia flava]|uniref:1-acyl-sn-glycerol-3-phosphate acyltransferase n=1 Tax=Saonia flava TaxID=523696 RepID=A0A846QZY9_9FLAO|nr:1-acyl-sn-glycerol-3-phosphate acyltransferase [Saonia flava]NJB72480.1 1-acyl-sn-glycerol-3-phosphate acyltransferase [Saonia flava]